MRQVLIIPNRNHLEKCLELAKQYNLGLEYNDFFIPAVLDDVKRTNEIIAEYKQQILPEYTTLHGAFFDVIPFSVDARIREIADLRIEQSVQAAKQIGAKAVVFHTNYNPFLNLPDYVKSWLEINVEYWKAILERHPDINLYLENMFDETPDLMKTMSESLSAYPNYGVCLDYGHAALSKVQPEIWAEQLGKYIKHVHINDNDLVSDLHLAWGDGLIKRSSFYECYEKYMKDATVLVETTPVENMVRSLEMLKKEGFI